MVSERRAEFLLVFISLLWAGTFVFTKNALDVCDPVFFISLRFAAASLACIVLWGRHLGSITGTVLRQGTILGLVYGIGFFFQTWGLQFTTVSKSSFITGMIVVFVPFAHWLLQRKMVEPVQLVGVAFAALGLFFLTMPDAAGINKGDATTLVGSVLWAFYVSYLDKISNQRQHDTLLTYQLVTIQFSVTALTGLLLHALFYTTFYATNSGSGQFLGQMRVVWTQDVVIALFYTALFGSLLATYIQTRYQQYVSPVKAGIIFTLEPVFATLMALAFTNERRMSNMEITGAALMLMAVFVADAGNAVVSRIRRRSS